MAGAAGAAAAAAGVAPVAAAAAAPGAACCSAHSRTRPTGLAMGKYLTAPAHQVKENAVVVASPIDRPGARDLTNKLAELLVIVLARFLENIVVRLRYRRGGHDLLDD